MKVLLTGILFVLTAATAQAQTLWNGILEPTRAYDWRTTGVPGGIPTRDTVCSTIAPYTGTAATINTAIATCPAGQTVQLQAGTFTLSTNINFAGKSNVTLKGAGPNQTFLVFPQNSSGCGVGLGLVDICLATGAFPYADSRRDNPNQGGQNSSNSTDWTAGYAQGTTTITLANTGMVQVGQMIFLDQLGDGASPVNDTIPFISCDLEYIVGPTNVTSCSMGRGLRPTMEIHKVTAKSTSSGPGTVTITPPILFTNFRSSQSPQAWAFNSGAIFEGSGVENLSIENTGFYGGGTNPLFYSIIQMRGCIGCFVRNVRSMKSGRDHIGVIESMFATVESNYMWGTITGTGGTTNYGVECGMCYFSRIQNNIGQKVTAMYIVNGGGGNVFGYNYANRTIYNEDGPNAVTQLGAFFPSHAAGSNYNLWEGNEGNMIVLDLAHGTSTSTTVFRSRFYGRSTSPEDNDNFMAFHNINFVRQTNAVGNVLGTQGYHQFYEASLATGVQPPGAGTNPNNYIWYLDWCGAGQCQISSEDADADAGVHTSLLRWKNCDYATDTCRSVAGEVPSGHLTPSSTLPASFYLTAKPDWFGNVPWPAIGPDVTGGADPLGWAHHIPAELCYRTVMGGSAAGTESSALAFNPDQCYGDTGAPPPPDPSPIRFTPQLNLQAALEWLFDLFFGGSDALAADVVILAQATGKTLAWTLEVATNCAVPTPSTDIRTSVAQSGPYQTVATVPITTTSWLMPAVADNQWYRVETACGASASLQYVAAPAPSPTYDDTAIKAAIAAVGARVTALEADVAALKATPAPPAPTNNLKVVVISPDAIEVTGLNCTSLKTTGTGLKRILTCVH